MFTIAKRFTFCASHQLTHLGPEHPCARLHGHNYTVELVLAAPSLDERGFVEDYRALGVFKTWVDETLDHRHLNDVVPSETTAERIAEWLWLEWHDRFPQLRAVRVSETDKTWAEFSNDQ